MMEKFALKNPSCVSYDEKLQSYCSLKEQVGNQPMVKEVDFIRLHLAPLAESVQDNANAWVSSLGQFFTFYNFKREIKSQNCSFIDH